MPISRKDSDGNKKRIVNYISNEALVSFDYKQVNMNVNLFLKNFKFSQTCMSQ